MSTIRADSIANRAGTGPAGLVGQSAAKAWANYNGVTPAVRKSFNISSITSGATGSYVFNYAAAMTDANSAAVALASIEAGQIPAAPTTNSGHTASQTAIQVRNVSNASYNASFVFMSLHGDLA